MPRDPDIARAGAGPGWFVTGTDTGVGKTEIALGLMRRLRAGGARVAGMKPVASGCADTPDGLRNADARRLLAESDGGADYRLVNPYAFAPPVAPHIAAARAGTDIDLDRLATAFRALRRSVDCVVVEGIGGWRVPLGPATTLADLVRRLDLPVVLVVGLRLGCINHALLSAEAVLADGLALAGWIGNAPAPLADSREIHDALAARIPAPCLGMVPHVAGIDPESVANCLRTWPPAP